MQHTRISQIAEQRKPNGKEYGQQGSTDAKFPHGQKESMVLEVRMVSPSGKEGDSDAGERETGCGGGPGPFMSSPDDRYVSVYLL